MIGPAAKISIIGAGQVGSTIAYSLAMANLGAEIILVNRNQKKARAEALDIAHGTCSETPVKVVEGDFADTKNSDVIILTVGIGPKPGESRLDIVHKNIELFKSIVPQLARYSPDSILLVVANPVDILTYVTLKLSGFNKERVIGSGTVIDTARLRLALRRKYQLPMRYLHTMILGEHGDSQVVIWSQTTMAGTPLEDYLQALDGTKISANDKATIAGQVAKMGIVDILEAKGYTNFGIAACVKRIVKAVLLNENAMLPVTVFANNEYGLNDVCLSLPSIVGSAGIINVMQLPLLPDELHQLKKSAQIIQEVVKQITF